MHRGAPSCPTSLQNWTLPRLDYRCWNDHWQSWETSDSEVLPSSWPCATLIAVFAQWTNFFLDTLTHTHTHNRLTALYPGLPGLASTRRDIQPLTPMRKKKKDSHRQRGLLWANKGCWTQSSQRTTKVGRLDAVKCYIFSMHACSDVGQADCWWKTYLKLEISKRQLVACSALVEWVGVTSFRDYLF